MLPTSREERRVFNARHFGRYWALDQILSITLDNKILDMSCPWVQMLCLLPVIVSRFRKK